MKQYIINISKKKQEKNEKYIVNPNKNYNFAPLITVRWERRVEGYGDGDIVAKLVRLIWLRF